MPGRAQWGKAFIFGGGALALTLMGTSPAWAEASEADSAEPFRLVWSSSAGCNDEQAFLAELEWRTARLRRARGGEHALTLIVETFRSASGVRGELTARRPDGTITAREVPAATCAEVQAAIALIAALMVDPLAGQPRRMRPVAAPSLPPSSAVDAATWSLGGESQVLARTAAAPSLSWGQALGVVLVRVADGWTPSVGLSARFGQAVATGQTGSAELTWTLASLALCPLGWQTPATWDLRACAVAELGRLRGAGFGTEQPASRSILWASAGPAVAARYALLGPLWLNAQAELNFPFSRERFYLEPGETLHQVPAWGATFGAGLGLRFF